MLKSIVVEDFRSIKGTINVPLDAPVVLIHGQNGSGKTSLLSAIELALTGAVPSFARFDDEYLRHLVHKDASQGRVAVQLADGVAATPSSGIVIRSHELIGEPLLSSEKARFYSERSYLAQSTLGRLLEIYEKKDTRKSDSPLTAFVKELLGLDRLDALIEGLHDAGNVRRLRTTVPAYWDVREKIPALLAEGIADQNELDQLSNDIAQLEAQIVGGYADLQRPAPGDFLDPEALSQLETSFDEEELQRLARIRRDLLVNQEESRRIQATGDGIAQGDAEATLARNNDALKVWRGSEGVVLESIFDRLRTVFSDLPPPAQTPRRFCSAASTAVTAELTRCAAVLTQDEQDVARETQQEEGLARAEARLRAIEKQIVDHSADAGVVAQALAELMPHIHTEDCPVCGRDFSETLGEPLQAHLSARIATLTESAGRLEALSRERAQTQRNIAVSRRERAEIQARKLAPEVRDELKGRRAFLEELRDSLERITPQAAIGEKLIADATVSARAVANLRAADQRVVALRDEMNKVAQQLGVPPPADDESIESVAARLLEFTLAREEELATREVSRRNLLSALNLLGSLRARRNAIVTSLKQNDARLARLRHAQSEADELIQEARELVKRVRDARTDVVRRVFNQSLNSLWRDLFVRLAPEEPFVPAFSIPENPTGPVEAVLETLYRSGGKGGNPRAMLSAGNLNTAALTLFLSLHLSAPPVLPCLVIDDPVQSMDEVHISQFAALLRTLSKQHGRQVIVAVHEKPLFDYLSLELSPAFENDRLITIELGRSANGSTVLNYEPVTWRPDAAIAA